MRLTFIFATLTSLSLTACGGDDGDTTPDAAIDIGFNTPTVTLMANREVAEDTWEEIGPADLSCLGTPGDDVASTVAVALTTKVADFQSGNAVPGAVVQVFKDQNYMMVEDMATADTSAMVTVDLPIGTKRFGYKMTASTAMPTFLLNQTLSSPDNPAQTVGSIRSVSNATAATLPALIGQTRTPGTGVIAGALRDCQDREVSGFIATMSSAPGMPTTIPGADAYYFSSEVGLPQHHGQQKFASNDGLFMIIEIPSSSPTGYVQMWGFPTAADMAMGRAGLKLIAELQVPVLSDTVITGSYEPLRQ
jgi:hypothetical protein